MMESQEHRATQSSPAETPRSRWLKQKAQARESWRAAHPRIGSLSLTGAERKNGVKVSFETRCSCGSVQFMRWSDLKLMAADELDHHCKPCAMREKMLAVMQTAAGRAKQAAMTAAACKRNTRSADAIQRGRVKWADDGEARIAYVMRSARQRCTNPNNAGYANYGERGIRFEFASVEHATRWVLDNLGRPEHGHTLDRIDNNRHYEPGNLRWATRTEQARNKRAYKNALPNVKIALALRPDLSASQIRVMLKRGDSLETIKAWRKYDRTNK